ncbi:acylphosphatase [Lapidilactobacillus achengensis]|uniref:Acylphosphatase n=1 Tax=Lapidilactobacillus achengensis TaxID=2486000 RepID=A0ABW1UN30_9LACO|nr:acylphosphatase [Lapidilactobacillus achengensis]
MRKRILLYGDTSFGGAKYFAQQIATLNGVRGFAKKDSQKITVEAQANQDKLLKFVEQVSKGNQFFKVTKVEVADIEDVDGEKTFSIK